MTVDKVSIGQQQAAGRAEPQFERRAAIYRRRILINTAPGQASVEMEDDFHRYGVRVAHDGTRVTAVEGMAHRTPWTPCVEATGMLGRLVGMALDPSPVAANEVVDPRQQCTHLFEMASLGIAHAARGTVRREYDVEAARSQGSEPRRMSVRRDGVLVMSWLFAEGVILEPPPFAGQSVRRVVAWARQEFTGDIEMLETVMLLRRAVQTSSGPILDRWFPEARDNPRLHGACYAFQPVRLDVSRRKPDGPLDFTDRPDALLADLKPTKS